MRARFILSYRRIYSIEVIFVRRVMVYFALLLAGAGLLFYPAQAAEGVRDGLRMCGSALIPALFPFFVLSRFAVSLFDGHGGGKHCDIWMRRLFGVSGGVLPALLLSMIGGYPVGVSTVVSLYSGGRITKRDAQRALLFCNNSGPAFFIGVVGGRVLGSVKAGLILYAIHCATAVMIGAFLAQPDTEPFCLRKCSGTQEGSIAQKFLDAVSGSCSALLQISALVLFFSVLIRLLCACGLLGLVCNALQPLLPSSLSVGLLWGMLEISGGVLQLSGDGAFVVCAFLLGWGGFCVHFQAQSLWRPAGLHPRGYFTAKLLHGLLSAFFAFAVFRPSALSMSGCVFLVCGVVFSCLVRKRGLAFFQLLRYNKKKRQL